MAPNAAGGRGRRTSGGRSTSTGRPCRVGHSRSRRMSAARISPLFAAATTAAMISVPASAPMASSATSAAWRAPGGLPAGLPEAPGFHRPRACFGPVFSGNAASIRRDDQHLGNWARGWGAATAAPSEPGRCHAKPPQREHRAFAGRGIRPCGWNKRRVAAHVRTSRTSSAPRWAGGWQWAHRQPFGATASIHQCPPLQHEHQAPVGGGQEASAHDGGRCREGDAFTRCAGNSGSASARSLVAICLVAECGTAISRMGDGPPAKHAKPANPWGLCGIGLAGLATLAGGRPPSCVSVPPTGRMQMRSWHQFPGVAVGCAIHNRPGGQAEHLSLTLQRDGRRHRTPVSP